ncbi:TetR family transcriptional regulator [Rhodococcus sp. WS1]|uniref:TetR/AcrR family transcriptional regulator n=1 Tax=unclassified Rhodococcus (in: high G+C Gram-positive bacteria) TaxID=192944 RepID=UPI0011426174|nr:MULTISPECIES: TetR/AcrR family transcriptional regulator [unclassified Rhodococcus (in: high G+C Gram-positive bacteria)]ROZ52944.1 TetR family transcriptional regulator [Rhodococcus sp. WS1]TQC36034.1 TetR family transcriptional regulator [Rhodococcus sp. WS7]
MPEDITPRNSMRDVARAAVRAELAKSTVDLILREGYEAVTVTDLAAAAGVSRSTFLRYLGSKEAAVVDALIMQRDKLAEDVLARPADETAWNAVTRSLAAATERYENEPVNALKLAQLVSKITTLKAATLERQALLQAEIAAALMLRPIPPPSRLAADSIAAAAVACFAVALDHWMTAEASVPMRDFFEDALAALGHGS